MEFTPEARRARRARKITNAIQIYEESGKPGIEGINPLFFLVSLSIYLSLFLRVLRDSVVILKGGNYY
jgi:hypothetical protein